MCPSSLSASTARPDIAESLAQAIFSGRYAPGDLIPRELDLCETFGVSRSTVRSVLQNLVSAGLLVRISNPSMSCHLSAELLCLQQTWVQRR